MAKTLGELAKERQPKATPVDEIPAVPELDMTLRQAAFDNHRNQYRGSLDEAGTVKARVYIGGSAAEHQGEILVASNEDATLMEKRKGRTGEIVKVEYRDTVADDTLIILWAPAAAKIEGVKVTL